jgi:hypothetical protein
VSIGIICAECAAQHRRTAEQAIVLILGDLRVKEPAGDRSIGKMEIDSLLLFPSLTGHDPFHELIKKRDGKGCIPVSRAPDHTLRNETRTSWT